MEKGWSFQQMVMNNWTSTCKKKTPDTDLTKFGRPLPKLTQMDHRLKCKMQNYKKFQRIRENLGDFGLGLAVRFQM